MDKKNTILATLAVASAVTVGVVIYEVIKNSNPPPPPPCGPCVSTRLDEKFKDNILTVNKELGKCIFDISRCSSKYVESNSKIPFEITLLKILNKKIKPISKFDKQLEYVQAVLVFRGWMCGIYLPMHYNDIDTALNEKGLEHSDENRLNMAIEYLKKSDCPELEVYGYHIDELVMGLKEMVGLDYSVARFFGVTDFNNEHKISDFAIADHDFGTLFATKRGEDWIFVCAVRAVQCAYPSPPPPPPASLAKSVKYESSPVETVEQVCCSL